MKKAGLIIGSIEITIGLLSLAAISIIRQVIPKLAKMCFMFNDGIFSESGYVINTGFANTVSVILCVAGIITIVYFCFLQKESI